MTMSGPDDDGFKVDLSQFCIQLVHHSQWKSDRLFLTGSLAEILLYREIVELDKENWPSGDKAIDSDRMTYANCHYATYQSIPFPETYLGSVIRIHTDDVHTGYVKLVREEDNTELRWDHLLLRALKDCEIKHGPAVLIDNKNLILDNRYPVSNVDIDLAEAKKVYPNRDDVYAIHSPYWPVEASEWITRTRSHGFPSKSIIKEVVRYGCDFVQVSHKLSNDTNEWRFSFSRAELFIARSFTTSQQIVYATLWAINKRIASSNLCTYYFKTHVLGMREQTR